MTINQVQRFLTVAQMKSFTKAADMMFVSHSTISQNISSLEESLGVTLLDRDNRSVHLTHAGHVLLEEGGALIEQWKQLEHKLQMMGMGCAESLTVNSINIYIEPLFNSFSRFQKEYPSIDLTISNNTIQGINESVVSGKVDIGVTYSFAMAHDAEKLDYITLDEGKFIVMVSNRHPLAGRESINLSDLKAERPLVLSQFSYDYASIVEKTVKIPGFTQEPFRVSTMESMLLRIKANAGFGIVPEQLAREYGDGCTMLKINDSDTRYCIELFYQRENPNPALPIFIELLREAFPGAAGK